MNERDTENLLFLMSATPESLARWWDQADEDDRQYAVVLMQLGHYDLIDKAVHYSPLLEAKRILSLFTTPHKEI